MTIRGKGKKRFRFSKAKIHKWNADNRDHEAAK